MGTSKWHALDHLTNDLREIGWLEYMISGLYEKSHELTKEHYALTSKRNGTVMNEIVSRAEDRLLRTQEIRGGECHVQTLRRLKLLTNMVHI